MPDAVLDGFSVRQRADFWQQVTERAKKQFVFVKTDGQDNIVGFVNGGLECEKDAIYTAEYALYSRYHLVGYTLSLRSIVWDMV